jgi:sec-independent protein translocase protein TatB
MPEALRTLGLWLGRLRRSFTSVKNEIEKEIGMDEVRRQLHNESVMEQMKRIEEEVQSSMGAQTIDPQAARKAADEEAQALDSETKTETEPSPAADVDAAPQSQQLPDLDNAEPQPAAPRARSEAELEAEHARRQKQNNTSKDQS